jgi:hypothetical protein
MATTTAFILAGKAHLNDGGINPYHCIQLTEGNAPCYTMRAWVEDDLIYEGSAGDPTRVMIPTLENPLEDLILMIMVFAVKDMADFRINNEEIVYMDRINLEKRKMLYAESQKLASKTAMKLVVSIITSDSLLSEEQLAKLDEYSIDYEVLTVSKKSQ